MEWNTDPSCSSSSDDDEQDQWNQKSREEVLEEARQKLKLFQETNKTSFKEDGTYRGILSVTSGLELPKKPLKSIPTADMIYKR